MKFKNIIFLSSIVFGSSVFAMEQIPNNAKWTNYNTDNNFFYYTSLDPEKGDVRQLEALEKRFDELQKEIENKEAKNEPSEDLKRKSEECQVYGYARKVHAAMVYKIHLQVKQEHLIEFVKKLMSELEVLDINIFKYARFLKGIQNHLDRTTGGSNLPVIVLYVMSKVDFLDNETRDKVIDLILDRLIKFVNNFCEQHQPKITLQDLAWPVVPRFNKKINDVVYIAGGDADYKPKITLEEYQEFLKTGKYNVTESFKPYVGMIKYSDDLCFVKGHEYSPPWERLSELMKKVKGALAGLRLEMQALSEKIGQLKDSLKPKKII